MIFPISSVGFFIPFQSLIEDFYPVLYQWIDKSEIKQTMSEKGFRLLYTDPKQFDEATPTKTLDRYFPHTDKTNERESPTGSLNIPVRNCDSSTVINWHKISSSHKNIVKFDNVADVLFEESEDTIFETTYMKMTEATLLRVDIFHSVRNLSNKRRIIAGWHTKPNIGWKVLLDIFSSKNLI